MKKYEIYLESHKTVTIEAKSAFEAKNLAREKNPGYDTKSAYSNDGQNEVSICEGCLKDFTFDETCFVDTENCNDYCQSCSNEMRNNS